MLSYFILNFTAKIINSRLLGVGSKHITIAWDVPVGMGGHVQRFQVKHFPKSQPKNIILNYTNLQNFTVTEFMLETEYAFQVRSVWLSHLSLFPHLLKFF